MIRANGDGRRYRSGRPGASFNPSPRREDEHARAGFGDLSLPHIAVLQYPGPDGCRPSELAERAGMSKQAMNQLLQSLERLGYIRRSDAEEGGRARIVHLTDRGHAAWARMLETLAEIEIEWRGTLGDEHFDQLKALLGEVWVIGSGLVARGDDRRTAERLRLLRSPPPTITATYIDLALTPNELPDRCRSGRPTGIGWSLHAPHAFSLLPVADVLQPHAGTLPLLATVVAFP